MEAIFGQIKIPPKATHSPSMRNAINRRFVEIFILCIPASKFLEFEVIGRLFATDIILIAMFPFIILLKYRNLKNQHANMIIIYLLFWLGNQIATDLIRDIQYVDCYRGWAKILVTLVHFITLYLILNKKNVIIVFLIGLCLGDLLSFYLNPNIYAFDFPWKFGIGKPLTIVTIMIASMFYKRSFLTCVFLLSLASTLNLYMDFRSLSGVCFITTIYLIVQYNLNRNSFYKLSIRQIVILFFWLILASLLFLKGYGQLAQHGLLGENAQQKYFWQSSGDLGIMIGGRSEILVASQAIVNSPIIGYGSWAKDYHYIDLLNQLLLSMGYSQTFSTELELIPTHSHFFGAWVEAGVFGAIFWGYVVYLVIKALTMKYDSGRTFTPILVFISFHLLWDIFFSPFGADSRFTTPFFIIVILAFLPKSRRHNKSIVLV